MLFSGRYISLCRQSYPNQLWTEALASDEALGARSLLVAPNVFRCWTSVRLHPIAHLTVRLATQLIRMRNIHSMRAMAMTILCLRRQCTADPPQELYRYWAQLTHYEWSSAWSTRTQQSTRKLVTSTRTKHRNCLNVELALILTLNDDSNRTEGLAGQKQAQSSHYDMRTTLMICKSLITLVCFAKIPFLIYLYRILCNTLF